MSGYVTTVEVGGKTLPIGVPIRGVRTEVVIVVSTVEGDGKGIPMHGVEYWFTEEERLIARVSAWEEGQS
jgi:hypothetical protein